MKRGSTNHEEQLRGNSGELEYLLLLKYKMVLYILRKLADSFDSLLFFLVEVSHCIKPKQANLANCQTKNLNLNTLLLNS